MRCLQFPCGRKHNEFHQIIQRQLSSRKNKQRQQYIIIDRIFCLTVDNRSAILFLTKRFSSDFRLEIEANCVSDSNVSKVEEAAADTDLKRIR